MSQPLRVGVTDLLRQPGTRREVERAVVLDDLAISTAAVPPQAPIGVHLELEAILGGLTASGTIDVPWTGECRRCLEVVDGVTTVDVQEVFEREPTEGETYPLAHDVVDLEPMVRDAALLALPLAPLCEDGCRGPAPDVFPAQIDGAADEAVADEGDDGNDGAERPKDPRWAALDQLDLDR